MKRFIALVFCFIVSCDFMPVNTSPDDRFTGTWEWRLEKTGYEYYSMEWVFDNSNRVVMSDSSNPYTYILDSTYMRYDYLWKIEGSNIYLKECDTNGFLIPGGLDHVYSFEFKDGKLIMDGFEYLKK